MVILSLPDLDEKNLSAEMIHHGLPSAEMPPFDGVVILTAGDDDPIREVQAADSLDERRSGLFGLGQMDIPFEKTRLNVQVQQIIKVFDESMKEMNWPLIGLMD
jgi:hypothetical protein